jgi:hypothetical protein
MSGGKVWRAEELRRHPELRPAMDREEAARFGSGSNEHGDGEWRGYLSRGFLGPRDDRADNADNGSYVRSDEKGQVTP